MTTAGAAPRAAATVVVSWLNYELNMALARSKQRLGFGSTAPHPRRTALRARRPVAVAVLIAGLLAACSRPPAVAPGRWRAWLDSPGGELPFELEIEESTDGPVAWVINGSERVPVPQVAVWRLCAVEASGLIDF